MRMSHIAAAAGLFVSALGVGTAADAQPYHGDRWHHGDREHRGRGFDRGHDRGRDWHHRCRTEWRHHHRVRVCR